MTVAVRPLPEYSLIGVPVNPIDMETLFELVEEAIAAGGHRVIANHNLHSVYLYHHDPKMRSFYGLASGVFIDGTPMIRWGSLMGYPLEYRHRITSIHWLRPLLARGIGRGWRTLLLGGKPGTSDRSAQILRAEMPGLQIESVHGYFDATPGHAEAEAVLERINAYRPDLLCVGMGMPRQEHWIHDFFPRLNAGVTFNLGGFMELITGELPTPPQWVGRANVEWLYRLITRPRRVWRRYLVEPWHLTPWLARDLASRIRRA